MSGQPQEVPTSPTAEKYRDRARSAATLLATAAGALTAGLIFSSSRDNLSGAAQTAAYISWVFFVISSCLYLWASLHSRSRGSGPADAVTKEVIDRIRLLTHMGSISGALAAGSLAAILPLDAALPSADKRVIVEMAAEAPKSVKCLSVSRSFEARVAEKDLRGNSPLIPLKVSNAQCSGAEQGQGEVVIYVDRTKALFIRNLTEEQKNG